MTDAAMPLPTRRLDMWFAGTSAQNRLTVAFRIILVIPQAFVLLVLSVVAFFVAVIGWFGALITGTLPLWAHDFLSGYVRWSTRVSGYLYLLTDRYPPFSLDDEDYPLRPVMPPPGGPLNRWSVLFRLVLAVPAGVFYDIVQSGLTFPLLFVMWFVVLVTGRMPPPLYTAYAALLRYQTRFHAWFTMLTPEYAWGMLGDTTPPPPPPVWAPPPVSPAAPPARPPAAPDAPSSATAPPGPQPTAQPYAYPSSEGEAAPAPPPGPAAGWPPPPAAPPPGAPFSPYAAAGAGAGPTPPPPPPGAYPASPPPATLPPWGTLIVQGAARGWMIFAIVWGSILFVGQNISYNASSSTNNNNTQYLPAPHGAHAPAHEAAVPSRR
jgi:Domain of unknown function (DUF4389)